MNLSPLEQEALRLLIHFWDLRTTINKAWHGIGLDDRSIPKKLLLYVDSKSAIEPLKQAAAMFQNLLPFDVLFLPRFQFLALAKTAKKAPKPLLGAVKNLKPSKPDLTKSAKPALHPLLPGQGVFAFDDVCRRGPTGTIGGFLEFADGNKPGPALLLSAGHVLGRDPQCRRNLQIFRDDDESLLSKKVTTVELRDEGNRADTAVAELSPNVAAIPSYDGITVTNPVPEDHIAGETPVEKLGMSSGPTMGTFKHLLSRIEITPNPLTGPKVFVDQMLIVSNNDKPFVEDGDSGGLLACHGRPAGIVIAKSKPEDIVDQPPDLRGFADGRYALASPFKAVLEELQNAIGRPVRMKLKT